MATRRLRFLGSTQRAAMLAGLRAELATWAGAWSVDASVFALQPVDSGWTTTAPLRWLHVTAPSGEAWLGAPEAAWQRLAGVLLHVSATETLQLADRIGARAARALLSGWSAAHAKAVVFDEAAPDAWQAMPRSGSSRYRLQGGDFDAMLLVGGDLAQRWATPSEPLPPLSLREFAVSDAQATFDVALDFGPATLEDAHALRVGDVLVSASSLDAPFRLRRDDGRVLVDGRLVRDGDRRAFLVDPQTPPAVRPTSNASPTSDNAAKARTAP